MAISKRQLRILLGAVVLCEGSVLSQQQGTHRENLPVGVWESAQADGSTIGIDLTREHAEDTAPGKDALQVGVFHKQHQRIACGEENYFVIGEEDPSHDALMSYAHGQLEIDYHDHVSGSEIHLNLILDPFRDVWTGHFLRDFHARPFPRQSFDGQVVLHRVSREHGGCQMFEGSVSRLR